MAEEFSVNISGIEEVCALLADAPKDLVRRTFTKALTAACVPVIQTLNSTTPELTGDMIDHLVTDIAVRTDGTGATAQIGYGSEGWKARLVEYGHRMVGHRPGLKLLGHVVAHPFMRPAVASSAEAAVEEFAESVQNSLGNGSLSIADLKVA